MVTTDSRVKDIMQPHVVVVPQDLSLHGLVQLLASQKISGVPVVDKEGALVGVVSMADVARHHARLKRPRAAPRLPSYYTESIRYRNVPADEAAKVKDVMSELVFHVAEDAPLSDATQLMLQWGIHRVPVTASQRQVVGILTTTDLVRYLDRLLAGKG